jgi:hypothetical protein
MHEQIKEFRGPLSKADAKIMLLQGELSNVSPVDAALLMKETGSMTILTGFERRANETQTHLDQEKVKVQVEQRAKKRNRNSSITMEMINKVS